MYTTIELSMHTWIKETFLHPVVYVQYTQKEKAHEESNKTERKSSAF